MNLKTIALRSGIHISKVKEAYEKALHESKYFNKVSEHFIYEIMEDLLDIKSKSLSSRFLESGKESYDDFLESLLDEELMSTDFAPSQKPEGGIKYNHKTSTSDDGTNLNLDTTEKDSREDEEDITLHSKDRV